ncbi:hypothetical protein Trydic_g23595 [Trypoxylus dichotomus]
MDPCGTPEFVIAQSDTFPPATTACFLPIANYFRHSKLSTREITADGGDEFSIPLPKLQKWCQHFGTEESQLDTFEVEGFVNIDYDSIISNAYSDVKLVKNENDELENFNSEEEEEDCGLEVMASINQEVRDVLRLL